MTLCDSESQVKLKPDSLRWAYPYYIPLILKQHQILIQNIYLQ